MSVKVMSLVWENPEPRGTARWVLLCLADFSNDDGLCWPGKAMIAKKTRITIKSVKRALRGLETAGYIKVERRKIGERENATNRYRITLPLPTVGVILPPVSKDPHPGGKISRPGGKVTPQTISDPPTEPTEKEKKPRKERAADPLSSHPAIAAYREVTGRYPAREIYQDVVAALGESPDLDLARACWRHWLTVSSNRGSSVWALEWYPAGGPPQRNGNGASPAKARASAGDATRHLVWTENK